MIINQQQLKYWIALAIVLCVIYYMICYYVYVTFYFENEVYKRLPRIDEQIRKIYETDKISLNSTFRECLIPSFDPFDSSVKGFIKVLPPLTCSTLNMQPPLLKFFGDFLWFDEELLHNLGTHPNDYQCKYFQVFRRRNPIKDRDKYVDIGPGIALDHPVVILKDYVKVKCSMKKEVVYTSTLLKVTRPSEKLLKRVSASSAKRPSIFILGFDSTSRLNFLRQMKKTSKFMEETLKGVYMKGLNKVAINTKPNMGVFLTGRHVFTKQAKRLGKQAPSLEEMGDVRGFWNDFPFVWKNFSENGFVTMFTEDDKNATFEYLSYGFNKEPTDYYGRPFFKAMETLYGFERNLHCFGGIAKHKYFLRYFQDFVSLFKKKRHFSYNFITDYSHDSINTLQYLDEDVWKMLYDLHSFKALENTIVVLLGDHGNRYHPIRVTEIGHYEEQMPLFLISLPEKFKQEYPHLQSGLLNNSDTLVSWFDMYELLMDVATGNFEEKSKVERYGFLGLSPFRTIPRNRSCDDIGIPLEYCICYELREVNTASNPIVKFCAKTLLTSINNELIPECEQLFLKEIISADNIKQNVAAFKPKNYQPENIFRIVIWVRPSDAIFEGYVNVDWHGGRVVGDISRINRYGNQSHCVDDDYLKKYCYCTDLVNKTTNKDSTVL